MKAPGLPETTIRNSGANRDGLEIEILVDKGLVDLRSGPRK
jgi:hypothetical protein